jgi:GT2 family glycosyltransferase
MVSIVTVNYKTADYVERMLESLYKHTFGCDFEVFIVENGSGQDLSKLEERFPQTKFIYSKQNLGFAGGCNLAIKQAKGDFILLVNPDIQFSDAAICQIQEHMRRDTDVGIAGISLRNMDGSQQECVWRFPTPLNQLLILFKLHHLFLNLAPYRAWKMRDFDYSQTADVDQVMGAFFCIRREVVDKIGMLDDGFFLWYEEVDFCRRATDAGWKVRYYADVCARHKGGSSFDRVATYQKQRVLRRSLRRYMKKHFGTGTWLLFVVLDPVFAVLSLVASVVKPM